MCVFDALCICVRSLACAPSPANLDDLFMFDLANMTWTRLAAANAPSARYGHGFTSAGGKLYVHGGYGAGGNALWRLYDLPGVGGTGLGTRKWLPTRAAAAISTYAPSAPAIGAHCHRSYEPIAALLTRAVGPRRAWAR